MPEGPLRMDWDWFAEWVGPGWRDLLKGSEITGARPGEGSLLDV